MSDKKPPSLEEALLDAAFEAFCFGEAYVRVTADGTVTPTSRPHGYTVSVKGAPNIAKAYWATADTPEAEKAALEQASRDWGIPVEKLYIYRGQDE